MLSTDLDIDATPGLHQMFKHLSKPIKVISDPNKRDDPDYRRRIDKHLNKITPLNIKNNLDHDLLGMASTIQDSLENNLTSVHNELYRELNAARRERERAEINNAKNQALVDCVARLEENERLSNRISTEKRDEIKPNLTYPVTPANEECVRRSRIAMLSQMKINEKSCSYDTDAYNYLLCLVLESNKVAEVHLLNKQQQLELILANVPSQDPRHALLKVTKTLEQMFRIISILASNVLTISDLEKKINEWKLDNSSDKAMYE